MTTMPVWIVNDKEFESVLSLPGPRRYAYFIKKEDLESKLSLYE